MPALAAAQTPHRIVAETAADRPAIDALVLAAFGPGRFAKTAERLREGREPAAGFVVRDGGAVIGSVRLWSIRVGARDALFLGPIAVAQGARDGGLGAALVAACVEEAKARAVAGILLVGDAPYFSRFGFVAAPDARLPGPADPRRVLWLPISEPIVVGTVTPSP